MDFDQVISKRVSVRSFTEKSLKDDEIKVLLDAANKAPIARGAYDDCALTVISDKELLREMVEDYQKIRSVNKDPIYGAPLFILFSSKKDNTEKYEDAGCLIQNICLKATEMGIGSVYIRGMINSLGPDAAYIKKLGLDPEFVPVSGVALGYTEKLPDPKDHKIETNYI